MSISEKLIAIAENEQKVYDSGIAWFEDKLLHGRESFGATVVGIFAKISLSGYTFKKTFRPVGKIARMFYDYKGSYLPNNMDFSGITSIWDSANNTGQCFMWSTSLKEIPDYGLKAMELGNSFDYCRELVTIEKIRITETLTPPTFKECISLVNLTFEGVIGKDISVSSCKKLSHSSLMNIIECLKDYSTDTSGTTYTFTMGADNIAKLEDDELAIITQKGWKYK